jgi:MarR family transcriptional repressor of emrRAB
MNSKVLTFSEMERHMSRVAACLPGLPRQEVILTRLCFQIAKALREMINVDLRPFALNYVSFSTLVMLFGSEDSTVNPSRLCNATGESRTNMTRITDELVARGFIKRQPSAKDRRRIVLMLTPKGRDSVRKILPLLWDKQKKIYRQLGTRDKQVLERLLKKQLAAIEALR